MRDAPLLKGAKLKPLTASDIRQGMAKRWAAPEYAIMWEVAEGTGAITTRRADAVIMSLWPSRGLELHGVEIKVSRSDWRREAADPRKAEAIGKYCDRWWIHTPPGVIQDTSELPPLWGLREFDGSKWRTIKEAGLRSDARACDRKFLAALLRVADVEARARERLYVERESLKDREAFNARVDAEVERRTKRAEAATRALDAFEKASGLQLVTWGGTEHAAEIGRIVKAVLATGIAASWGGLASLAVRIDGVASEAAQLAERLRAAAEESGVSGRGES